MARYVNRQAKGTFGKKRTADTRPRRDRPTQRDRSPIRWHETGRHCLGELLQRAALTSLPIRPTASPGVAAWRIESLRQDRSAQQQRLGHRSRSDGTFRVMGRVSEEKTPSLPVGGARIEANVGAFATSDVSVGLTPPLRCPRKCAPSRQQGRIRHEGAAARHLRSPHGGGGPRACRASARRDEDNRDIYVKLVGPGPPLRLTTDPAGTDSAWSPDGRLIAFERFEAGIVEVFVIPALGGAERMVATLDSASVFRHGREATSPLDA